MKRATLKDIARLTGLSPSTVSRALKSHPDISAPTIQKVREVAEALNYAPNHNARSLRTNSSHIIAVILPKVNTFFFPELLEGISQVVAGGGYSLIFLQSDNSLEKEKELIDFCISNSVEGVLLSVSIETHDTAHLQQLYAMGIPVVMVDHILEQPQFPAITINDEDTAYRAVKHLLEQGHQHIVGVFDDPDLRITRLRTHGFRRALQEAGLNVREGSMRCVRDEAHLNEEIATLLDQNPEATAFFAMSDKIMVQAYHVFKEKHIKIPSQMALIAISDGKAPYYLYPNISYFRHSGKAVGSHAAEILFEAISAGKLPEAELIHIPTPLIQLKST